MSELTAKQVIENIFFKEREIFKVIACFTGFKTETISDELTKIFIYGKHVGNIRTVANERLTGYKVTGEFVGDPSEFADQIAEGLKLYKNFVDKSGK